MLNEFCLFHQSVLYKFLIILYDDLHVKDIIRLGFVRWKEYDKYLL